MDEYFLCRGKRADNGKLVEGNFVKSEFLNGGGYEYFIIEIPKDGATHRIIPETAGRYIGLKDDNGKKIFEHDILKLVDHNNGIEWFGVVKFGNPNGLYSWGYQIVPIVNQNVNTDILLWVETGDPNTTCEIVGNIHDNPVMLTE